MAKSVISGLTITIGADTAKFSTAMKNIDSEARRIAKDLKNVSESLKIDPGNAEAFASKLKLLQEAAGNATSRVEAIKKAIADLNRQYSDSKTRQDLYNQAVKDLKEALDQGKISQDSYKKSLEAVKEQYGKGNISQKEYEEALKKLERQLESANYEQGRAVDALDQYQRETSDTAKDVDKLGDEQKETNREVKEFSDAAEQGAKGAFNLGDAIKARLTSEAILSGLRRLKDLAVSIARELINAGKELAKFSFSAIEDAASYQDALGYSETIFGDTVSKQVQTWVNENTNALRIYKGDLLQNMNTFGQLFQTMGLKADKSFDMASNILSLAADLRAATGKDSAEILDTLAAGFTNTTRVFRQFGVRINEAEIKAYALDNGIIKLDVDQTKLADKTLKVREAVAKQEKALDEYGETSLEYERATVNVQKAEDDLNKLLNGKVDTLTAADRTTAIYLMLLEQLRPLIGQNEKESGLFNSQLAETETRMRNLKETIGEQLLPVATDLLTKFNEFLDSEEGQAMLQSFVDKFKEWGDTIQKMVEDGTIQEFLSNAAERIPQLVEDIGNLVTKLIELMPQLEELAEKILNLFGIETEAEKAKKAYITVADQVELMASRMHISTETARTAVNEFAETNDIKLSEIYSNWQKYEPQIIAFMGDVTNGAEDLENGYKEHLETLPETTRNAITDISTTDLSPLENFLYRVGYLIGSYVQQFIDAWNRFKNFVMSGTDENPTPNVSWEDQPALDPNFISLNANGRSSGGFVRKGGFYRINDDAGHRIEAFVPGQNGYILNGNQVDRIVNNNNSRNFSGGVTINAYCPGLTVAQVAEELGTAFYDAIRIPGRSL